jgi:hypothetical protein
MVWICTLGEHVQQRLVFVVPMTDDAFRRFGVDEPPPSQRALCRLYPNHRLDATERSRVPSATITYRQALKPVDL